MAAGQSRREIVSFVALTLVVVGLAGGCSSAAQMPTAMNEIELGKQTPYDLYTHCGINEFKVNGKYFQRVGGSLSNGAGSPPAGWDNPFQSGTLTVSDNTAIFRDKKRHVETFKVRTGAKAFLMICS